MTSRMFIIMFLSSCITFAPLAWGAEPAATEAAFNKKVTKEDISICVKKYIEEQTKKGNGKFHFKDGKKELSLTLV